MEINNKHDIVELTIILNHRLRSHGPSYSWPSGQLTYPRDHPVITSWSSHEHHRLAPKPLPAFNYEMSSSIIISVDQIVWPSMNCVQYHGRGYSNRFLHSAEVACTLPTLWSSLVHSLPGGPVLLQQNWSTLWHSYRITDIPLGHVLGVPCVISWHLPPRG